MDTIKEWKTDRASVVATLDAEKIPAHDSIHERVQELARQRRNTLRTLDVYTEQVAALKDALGVGDFADLRGAVEKLKADLAAQKRSYEDLFVTTYVALDTVGAPPASTVFRRIGLAFSQAQVDRCALEDVHDALRRSEFGGAVSGVPGRVKDALESLRVRSEYIDDLHRTIAGVRDALEKAGVTPDIYDALLRDAVSKLAAERDAARAEVERLSQHGLNLETADNIIKAFGGPPMPPLHDKATRFVSTAQGKKPKTKPRAKATTKAPRKKASRRG